MDPVQVYETALYDRNGGQGFRFVTVPVRSLSAEEVPPVEVIAQRVGLDSVDPRGAPRVEPVEAWSLPFLIDAAMGRPDFPSLWEERFWLPPRVRRGPSEFAQYLAFAPVIPFESSPLSGKSLSDVITAAGGSAGAAVGAFGTHEPLLLIAVPFGIVLCGAARGVGDALRIGLRARLLDLMHVEDPERRDPPDSHT
jgi:hypothetical protein